MLRSKSAGNVCSAFMECWATLCTGYPSFMRIDHDSSNTSDAFTRASAANILHLKFSGVEGHNSLDTGERYHAPLRHVF